MPTPYLFLIQIVARIVIAGVTAYVLALAYADLLGNSYIWLIELIRYVPFPVFLVPSLAAAGMSILLGRWWRWAAAFTLLGVLISAMNLSAGFGDEGSGKLRVMTYNIKSYLAESRDKGYGQIAWEIVQHDPDVVLIQDANMLAGPTEEMPDSAKAMLKGRQVYSNGQYMVASRYPLKGCKRNLISFRSEDHGYIQCTTTVAGVEVDLVTAHFVSPRPGLTAIRHQGFNGLPAWKENFSDRMTQANLLAADLAQTSRPTIVGGDLNAPPRSPVIGALARAGLRDAFAAASVGYGYTYGHALKFGFSYIRIDHILVSSTIGVRKGYVGGNEGSEHRPVIADLLLKRAEN